MLLLIIWIVCIGLIAYAVNRYAPIPVGMKTLIYVICIVWAVLLTLHAFGISLGSVPSPTVR
jgi:hypothetical protein